MKMSALGKTWDLAVRNNTILLITNVILTVLLAFSVGVALSSRERIVLVPPHLDKKVEVAWHNASADYLKSFGLYVVTLIGNVTPKNVTLVADSMGAFLDPSIYPQIRAQIKSLSEDPIFQKANAINYFAPDQAIYEVDTNKKQKVFIVGQLVTSSFENSPGSQNSRAEFKWVTYEMGVVMRDGRPVITEFTSYPGNVPHTAKWLASQSPSATERAADASSKKGEE